MQQEVPEPEEQDTDDTPPVVLGRLPDVLMQGRGIRRPWDF